MNDFLDLVSRIEKMKDFIYNDKQVKKIENACEYLMSFVERYGSMERLISMLHIIEEQSYILKDDYTLDEVAKYLGVSKRTVYKMVEDRMFQFSKPNGKNILVKRVSLMNWIDSGKCVSKDEMDILVLQKLKELDERRAKGHNKK